jgi:AmmeMemoRadiSam system protein A
MSGERVAGGRNMRKRQDALVDLARRAIEAHVTGGVAEALELAEGEERVHGGVFVSLHRGDGSLRGCLGTISSTRNSLAEEIAANAVAAATSDPRFPPVSEVELADLHVSVDVLAEPEEIQGIEQLDPTKYGIIVRTQDGRQALLLPDLEGVSSAEMQLKLTCHKGGIRPDESYRVFRFTVTRHR